MSTPAERETFLFELARALHESGVPAHRLEASVDLAAKALGLAVDCFSQPTSLYVASGDRVRLMRVQPREVDLGRMIAIDRVASEVARGEVDVVTGAVRLREAERATRRYGPVPRTLAACVVSASAAVFFGGGLHTVLTAAALGFCVGLFDLVIDARTDAGRLQELLSALLVAAGATVVARFVPINVPLATLAGVILALPGLTTTVALTELATRHLASGTARLMGAGVTFLQLGVGTGLGWKLGALLPPALRGPPAPLPESLVYAVVPIEAAALVVLFKARLRDWPVIVGMAYAALYASREGGALLGAELGACIGGFAVGVLGNLQSRLRGVPAAVAQLPGLLMLVPGSLGYRGVGAMMQDEVTEGVGMAFSMFLVAASLVGGLLAAGMVLPSKKTL